MLGEQGRRLALTAGEVVEPDHLVALLEQLFREMSPDEPRRPGDANLHSPPPTRRAKESRIAQPAAGSSFRRREVPAIAGMGIQLLLAELLVLLGHREARFRVLRPLVAHRPRAIVRETGADLASQFPARVPATGCRQGEHADEEWQELDNAAGHCGGDLPRIALARPTIPLISERM